MKTIGSLFAGIGGFDLGFERAGFRTSWAVEIDKHAQAVLRRRFPHAQLHDDVCKVGAHNLGPVDVVTFGSPCQDLSVAGKRAGLAGERSGLFHEATRIIRELRAAHGKPDFAIWENVPGAFSSNKGEDFAAVLRALADIGALDIGWRVLDSRFFGVAQRRRRVFLVADFGGERAEQVLALAQGVRGYSPQSRQARQGSTGSAGYSPATSGAVTSKWAKGGGPAGDEHYNLVATHVPPKAACLETTNHDYNRADGFTAVAFNWQEGPSGSLGVSDADTGGSPPVRVSQTLAVAFDGYNQTLSSTSQTIRADKCDGDHVGMVLDGTLGGGSGQRGWANDLDGNGAFIPMEAICIKGAAINRKPEAGPQYGETLTEVAYTQNRVEVHAVMTPKSVVRRLTPIECCRLQGFPDDWNSEGVDKTGRRFSMADAPRYRQLGNAVTVNVANWIANNIWVLYNDDAG